jgi:outer membrane protein assembly factor BamB
VGAVRAKARPNTASSSGFPHFVYGLDAQTGQQLWSTRADDHFIARITAAPIFHDGKV